MPPFCCNELLTSKQENPLLQGQGGYRGYQAAAGRPVPPRDALVHRIAVDDLHPVQVRCGGPRRAWCAEVGREVKKVVVLV
jgi:hypothetical protein